VAVRSLFFLVALAWVISSEATEWEVTPGPLWTVEGNVVGSMDMSGLACERDANGLLVSDETRSAQQFRLDRERRIGLRRVWQ
jgi:hypothetical protein